jgi:hypothetical protein
MRHYTCYYYKVCFSYRRKKSKTSALLKCMEHEPLKKCLNEQIKYRSCSSLLVVIIVICGYLSCYHGGFFYQCYC